MKTFLLAAALISQTLAAPIEWLASHEDALEKHTLELAKKLPHQTIIIGRTGLAETRVATVISDEGHILSPYLASIDGEDAPYLIYQADGSRLELKTIAEKADRFLALLQLPASLKDSQKYQPTAFAEIVDHTLVIPTCAPIASLGEISGLYVEHLEFSPPEKVKAIRIDSSFHKPGTLMYDLAGQLVAVALKPRNNNTPALMMREAVSEFPELSNVFPELQISNLPDLPLAPTLEREERRGIELAALTEARQDQLNTTFPSDLPCVLIYNGNQQVTQSILGTIVRQDGLILTKASDIGPEPRVRYQDETYPAILLATDEKTDLALLGIEATGLPVINWSDHTPEPGATLAAPILINEGKGQTVTDEASCYVGNFVQILAENTPTIQATSKVTSLGLISEQLQSGLTISATQKDSPAQKAGLLSGDVIQTIDGKKLTLRAELTALLDSHQVGDELTLNILRDQEEMEFKIALIAPNLLPPSTGIDITSQNIPMIPSVRRYSYPDVIVHTTPLNSWDCGSPLFDRQGRAIGLNIAAHSAARTLALRPTDIREALNRLLAETRTF